MNPVVCIYQYSVRDSDAGTVSPDGSPNSPESLVSASVTCLYTFVCEGMICDSVTKVPTINTPTKSRATPIKKPRFGEGFADGLGAVLAFLSTGGATSICRKASALTENSLQSRHTFSVSGTASPVSLN